MTTLVTETMFSEYGAGLGHADPIVVLWATEKVAEKHGNAEAKKAMRQVNRKREKMGLATRIFEYGHPLF